MFDQIWSELAREYYSMCLEPVFLLGRQPAVCSAQEIHWQSVEHCHDSNKRLFRLDPLFHDSGQTSFENVHMDRTDHLGFWSSISFDIILSDIFYFLEYLCLFRCLWKGIKAFSSWFCPNLLFVRLHLPRGSFSESTYPGIVGHAQSDEIE